MKTKLLFLAITLNALAIWPTTYAQALQIDDMTGNYFGLFAYESRTPSSNDTFTMTLVQTDNVVTGRTTEIVLVNGKKRLSGAYIRGKIEGNSLNYTKTYDGTAGRNHSISYQIKMLDNNGIYYGRWAIGSNSGFVILSKAPFADMAEALDLARQYNLDKMLGE